MDPTAARALATQAHSGQTDKAGQPYIEHPERVAARLTDPDAQVVALLHDVIEDTELSADDLRAAGASELQVKALEALAHADDVSDKDYWRALRAVPLARLVKVADLADNTDPARIALLAPAEQERFRTKYRSAMAVIGWDETPDGELVRPEAWAEMERLLRPSEPTLGADTFGDRPVTG
jgi:(p)ppGpp synthase/HD superfamily hydrolase